MTEAIRSKQNFDNHEILRRASEIMYAWVMYHMTLKLIESPSISNNIDKIREKKKLGRVIPSTVGSRPYTLKNKIN